MYISITDSIISLQIYEQFPTYRNILNEKSRIGRIKCVILSWHGFCKQIFINVKLNKAMNENEKTIDEQQLDPTQQAPAEESARETDNEVKIEVEGEDAPADASADASADEAAEASPEQRISALEAEIESLKKDALYRAAEFDNYRKRTIQEKADLIKYGSQKAIEALLPVIDDLERAMQHIDKAEDIQSVKEGVDLIMQKFQGYLKQQQVTIIPAAPGDDFDDTIHEAITMFPAPDPSLKGKIVDCPTKGYKLYDKVVRYAKVVVGQ